MAKILLNGSEPTDIKLNGTTPDKIILNGVAYWEKPPEHNYLYKWDFTKSLVDEINNTPAYIYDGVTKENDGLKIPNGDGHILVSTGGLLKVGYTYEIDIANMEKKFSAGTHGRFIMRNYSEGFIFRHQTSQWEVYNGGWKNYTKTSSEANVFNNKTMKIIIYDANNMEIYANDELVYKGDGFLNNDITNEPMYIGSSDVNNSMSFYDVTISGVRIYENEA